MGKYNSSYWKGLYAAAKVIGIVAIIVGAIFLMWGIIYFFKPDKGDAILFTCTGLFAITMGIFLIKAKPGKHKGVGP